MKEMVVDFWRKRSPFPSHHPGTGIREAGLRSQYFQIYINYKLAILKCSKVKVPV